MPQLPTTQARPDQAVTPVVGLGASAGGLEALQLFIGSVPAHSGMAFVVVQHMDPTQPALLSQLLQRITAMQVSEAIEGMHIAPDRVYVIPPNRSLTVAAGQLHLAAPIERRGMRLPIDALFESLAEDQRENAVAVVLSGMGSDGTLGLRAVKARGGLTLAQTPATAQFDAMPKNAIASNCVDIVAAPEKLAARIVAARLTQVRGVVPTTPALSATPAPDAEVALPTPSEPTSTSVAEPWADASGDDAEQDGFAAILRCLMERGGHDFSQYKRSTLLRRIERRMRIHSLDSMLAYLGLLRDNPQEVVLLGKELLIGVTSFFRDRPEWKFLAEQALPRLLAERAPSAEAAESGAGVQLRAWVVGCSTGEEAYTLAMLLCEAFAADPQRNGWTFRLFATDLSLDAIETARRGWYAESIAADVSEQRLQRFFTRESGGYRVAKNIRESVVFAPHDANGDAPFTKLDIVTCRNLLIYLTAPLQQRLLRMFHYILRPGGLMMLGTSESVGRATALFEPADAHVRIFRRREVAGHADAPYFPVRRSARVNPAAKESAVAEPELAKLNLQDQADRLLLKEYSPPAVLVNPGGDILYIHGRTGKYLEPAAGKANWNIHAMAREGIRLALAAALREASENKKTVQRHGLVPDEANSTQTVDVTVREVHDPGALAGTLLIVFHERFVEAPVALRLPGSKALRGGLQLELLRTRQDMQAMREEMKASQEELQAANEELQSTNEELQSTNEELTSSKEEMQSMNEELQAVNVELKVKLDDLALAQSDMKNLLDSTQIATLFLDNQLNVRRFTEKTQSIVSLRESDVGRPLSDLTSSLDYADLLADARETLRTLATCEKQIASRDGRWFSVRIMPYRSLADVIRGVVITLVDITSTKQLEAKLRAA